MRDITDTPGRPDLFTPALLRPAPAAALRSGDPPLFITVRPVPAGNRTWVVIAVFRACHIRQPRVFTAQDADATALGVSGDEHRAPTPPLVRALDPPVGDPVGQYAELRVRVRFLIDESRDNPPLHEGPLREPVLALFRLDRDQRTVAREGGTVRHIAAD